jgi:hypothetical protein
MKEFEQSPPLSVTPIKPTEAAISVGIKDHPQASAIARIAAALSKAQGVIQAPAKSKEVNYIDKKGQTHRYKYADLADVYEAIRKPFAENGLSVSHILMHRGTGPDSFGLVTRLMHSSGEEIHSWYPLPNPGRFEVSPQAFGSSLTYAKRYSVSGLAGLAAEDDDDGQIAEPVKTPSRSQNPSQNHPEPQTRVITPIHPSAMQEGDRFPVSGPPTNAQLGHLFETARDRNWTTDQVKLYMDVRWGIRTSKELTRNQYDALLDIVIERTYGQAIEALKSKMPTEELK